MQTGKSILAVFLTLLFVGSFSCVESYREPADLVLQGGKIVTLDESSPEVEALAVRGDRIVALGPVSAIQEFIGPNTEVIELEGQLAVPGFIEGHGHFTGIGEAKLNLELMHVSTWEEIVQKVAEAVQNSDPGEWILGRGWHQEKWDRVPEPNIQGFPLHDSLSQASPDNPVLLTHASGHAAFANALAMRLAGISAATPDPEGGEIVRDQRGDPIGVFRETAQRLLRQARSAQETSQLGADTRFRRVVELATDECLSKGITSFQDAGSSLATVDRFLQLDEEGALRIRLWVMLRDSNERLADRLAVFRRVATQGSFLTVRAIKRSIDGALGSHGAWLLQPYSDFSESSGLNTSSVESVRETARLAIENDFQLCVHAIGDRANREVLDLYQQTFEGNPERRDLRWRIEHAQHLHPDDIPRFGELGVIASMQGIHCTSDAPWVVARLGEKRAHEGAYVWQKLMKSGAVVINGTDAPVEDVSPIQSYYASISRRTQTGDQFYPEQRMSRQEALRSYTIDAAFAAFEENSKGSLEPGKLADIVVLSQDILTVAEEEIPKTKVLFTIVGGRVAWPRPLDGGGLNE